MRPGLFFAVSQMIQSVSQHYAAHLSRVYSWMLGGVEAALKRGSVDLDTLCLQPKSGALAVDLGAGFGMHAIPLARRGYSVLAVDTDPALLDELSTHAHGLPIRPVVADLLNFRAHLNDAADLIVCMGDTLTHLSSPADVNSLVADVAASLTPDGVFVCTFRDYTQELSAERRFIPVRSDRDRILTCFLEYADQRVTVHDLLHERQDGQWSLSVSSYQKIRLAPGRVRAALEHYEFQVTQSTTPGGMVCLIAQL